MLNRDKAAKLPVKTGAEDLEEGRFRSSKGSDTDKGKRPGTPQSPAKRWAEAVEPTPS